MHNMNVDVVGQHVLVFSQGVTIGAPTETDL